MLFELFLKASDLVNKQAGAVRKVYKQFNAAKTMAGVNLLNRIIANYTMRTKTKKEIDCTVIFSYF